MRRAVVRRDVVVIVDVLRFSTAVAVALQHGALIYPCAHAGDVAALNERVGAESGGDRPNAPVTPFDPLSPAGFLGVSPGARLALASPNGATCCLYGRAAPYLFAGALVNAAAVGAAVALTMRSTALAVTVIACGERWPRAGEDGALRFALEDYLGAGALLSHLPFDKSPEALVCEQSFRAARDQLTALLHDCGSGRELRQKGRAADVEYAAQLDCCATVPVLRQERLEPFHPSMLG